MKTAGLLLGLLLAAGIAWAGPAQIILLRHAEKPPEDSALHLSERGRARASALVSLLTNEPALLTNGLPVALFAPAFTRHGHGVRPYETLAPLAERLKLPIQTPCASGDYGTLAKRILKDPAFDGKTVVVCWVHDYIPALAEALGVKSPPAHWKGSVYDRLWVITYPAGRATLAERPEHLLPGDSTE
jgi:hypothetical protein